MPYEEHRRDRNEPLYSKDGMQNGQIHPPDSGYGKVEMDMKEVGHATVSSLPRHDSKVLRRTLVMRIRKQCVLSLMQTSWRGGGS